MGTLIPDSAYVMLVDKKRHEHLLPTFFGGLDGLCSGLKSVERETVGPCFDIFRNLSGIEPFLFPTIAKNGPFDTGWWGMHVNYGAVCDNQRTSLLRPVRRGV